jgi:hypothetical protein
MIAYTDDGIAVEWHSSSVPVEQLDAALSRDRNLTLRFGERLLAAALYSFAAPSLVGDTVTSTFFSTS